MCVIHSIQYTDSLMHPSLWLIPPCFKNFVYLYDDRAVRMIVAKQPALCSIQKDDGYTPLHVAVVNNHLDIIRVLLETVSV